MHYHNYYRYEHYAREAEKAGIRADFSASAILGGLFFIGLAMVGTAFWYNSYLFKH